MSYKIALALEYDGSRFHGWQRQGESRTVQATVEAALSQVAAEPISVICAGRTDTGVHAKKQIIHFETTQFRPEKAWVYGTNTFLPDDVAVYHAQTVASDFSARFSALARRYHYIILNQKIKPAVFRDYFTWEFRPLNIEFMQQAAHYFYGEQDFSSFRSAKCQSTSAFRHIDHLIISQEQNKIIIDIKANAFLHHMVRNIAGVLMDIGAGEKPVSWAQEVIAARDRCQGSVTAKPNGLYLVDVEYPLGLLAL